MNLGNLLKQQGGTPLTGRLVEFVFLSEDKEKNRVEQRASAMLFPVDEKRRAELVYSAREYCSEVDSEGKRVNPEANLDDEIAYRFLLIALRDTEDPRIPWAVYEQLPQVRKGLIQPQCVWLAQEYDRYLADQYPELRNEQTGEGGATVFDAQKVKAEAKATFTVGQDLR